MRDAKNTPPFTVVRSPFGQCAVWERVHGLYSIVIGGLQTHGVLTRSSCTSVLDLQANGTGT